MSRGEIGVAYIAWKIRLQLEPGHDRERRLERGGLHRRRGQQAGRQEDEVRHAADRVRVGRRRRPARSPSPSGTAPATGTRRRSTRGTCAGRSGSGARRPGRWPTTGEGWRSTSSAPSRSASGRSGAGRRPRATTGGPGPSRAGARARGPRRRPPRRRRRRAARGRAGARPARRCRRAVRRASPPRPGAKRSSVTSRVEYCSIRARGLPSATILALSMTTSRSHSCSASSM